MAIKTGDTVAALPAADYVFDGREHLMVLAHHKNMEEILKKSK